MLAGLGIGGLALALAAQEIRKPAQRSAVCLRDDATGNGCNVCRRLHRYAAHEQHWNHHDYRDRHRAQ